MPGGGEAVAVADVGAAVVPAGVGASVLLPFAVLCQQLWAHRSGRLLPLVSVAENKDFVIVRRKDAGSQAVVKSGSVRRRSVSDYPM